MNRCLGAACALLALGTAVTCSDQVPNQRPAAEITLPGQDTTVGIGMPVDFQGSASDPDGTVAAHAWDFGDGHVAAVEDPGPHTYAAQGVYTVTYQVTDDGGAASAPDTLIVTALPAPLAMITRPGRDTTVILGTNVEFQGSANDPDGTVVSHAWDFGDGTTAAVEDPGLHLYAARGLYTVTYRATDDDGVTSAPDTVIVAVNETPVARIDSPGSDTTARWPYALDFRGTASDVDGTVAEHHWDFGDGNVADVEDPGPYAYDAPGMYTVTYRVTDEDGATSEADSVVVTVEQTGIAPEPGPWMAWPWPSLGFQFVVDDQGAAITRIDFMFRNWACGPDTLNGRIAVSPASAWPIADAAFTIAVALIDPNLTMTFQGSFTSSTEGSGTWSAVRPGATCSGDWQGGRTQPTIAVFMARDFSRTVDVVGFDWLPGRQVTLEIDRGGDGTIDAVGVTRPGLDGTARFHDPATSAPFQVTEGDSLAMHDTVRGVGYVVLYVTLDSVDPDLDLVSGAARVGTQVTAWIDIGQSLRPEVVTVPDATGHWSASFVGIYDIGSGTHVGATASCLGRAGGWDCGGATAVSWP